MVDGGEDAFARGVMVSRWLLRSMKPLDGRSPQRQRAALGWGILDALSRRARLSIRGQRLLFFRGECQPARRITHGIRASIQGDRCFGGGYVLVSVCLLVGGSPCFRGSGKRARHERERQHGPPESATLYVCPFDGRRQLNVTPEGFDRMLACGQAVRRRGSPRSRGGCMCDVRTL